MAAIYWKELDAKGWRFVVAATENGLCFVGSEGKSVEELEAWANSRGDGLAELVHDAEGIRVRPYMNQLEEYLEGNRRTFELPLDLRGTEFQREVWRAMSDIPHGATATYSDIAGAIGKPKSVRAVGAAIGRNPALILLPCHRIVGKSGALTGYRGGLPMKERLLRLERLPILL